VAAVSKQATAITDRTQVPVTVTGPARRLDLEPRVEEHLYRLTMEALHNSLKHASPSTVTIVVSDGTEDDPRCIQVEVVDDGVGFDPGLSRPGHLGLGTMRDRAASIGAVLELRSAPGKGTRVTVRLTVSG
jgi:signal transduction histidine kinase